MIIHPYKSVKDVSKVMGVTPSSHPVVIRMTLGLFALKPR